MILFLICSFATFYASFCVSKSEGPASIFRRIRSLSTTHSNFGRGIRCPVCSSAWIAAPITAYAVLLGLESMMTPLFWLGISGVSSFLHGVDEL